ncbi:hypothetical protein Tco_1570105 [Tanacetum coccineum]
MRTRSQSRNSNRQQQQVNPTFVEPFNLIEPIPVVTMDDNRTMAQLLEARCHRCARNHRDNLSLSSEVPERPEYVELHQLDTFYNALNSNDQDSLNFDTGEMVKSLLSKKKNQNQASTPVKAVEESCVTCGGTHSYRNCPATDGNVYRDNIQEYVSQAAAANFNQGNSGYRAPIANQIRPPVMRNMQDQNQNLQNQMTNLTDMLSKFVNSNTASTSGSGTLPSNTITNPKVDLKGITTRSGVAYQGPMIPTTTSSPPKVVEREPEVTKDTVPPINNRSTKDVQPLVVQVENQKPNSEPVVDPVSAPMPNPKPSIPYPSRRNDEKHT